MLTRFSGTLCTTVKGKGKGAKGDGKSKGKGKGKAKGAGQSGKGPKSGCFTCGGPHYASNCPAKGKASELQPQQPWTTPGQNGASPHHPMPQPLGASGPPGVHPALAQCNTGMPGYGETWMAVLEADESYIHNTILPKATHTFKSTNNNKSSIFAPKPTIIKNSFSALA